MWTIIILLVSGFTIALAGNVEPREEIYLPNYQIYHNFSTITRDITAIAKQYPSFIKLDNSFTSRSGHSQLLLHVTNSTFESRLRKRKRRVLLSYGEHAREFFPVESLFHLLNNLTQGTIMDKNSPQFQFSSTILSNIDMYIITIMNPDGRLYVETSKNYCWRGTKTGVDLNRNFDWQFGGKGSSGNKKDEEYRGPYPFSGTKVSLIQ